MPITGSEFTEKLLGTFDKSGAPVQGSAREALVLEAASQSAFPSWLLHETWREVHVEADIGKVTRKLTYFVIPDYLSIGIDDDFLRMPARPSTYQTIANQFHAILPSRRIVNAIWGSADVHLPPITFTPDASMTTSAVFVASNDAINKQLHNRKAWPTGKLIGGDKKDVVIAPGLDGSRVAIYGWHDAVTGKPIQPFPGPHTVDHVDYSHGCRLIARAALLDGDPVDLATVFNHPDLHVLVSDQGPFLPFFPNAGPDAAKLGRALKTAKLPKELEKNSGRRVWGTLEWLGAVSAILGIVNFFRSRAAAPKLDGKP